MSISALKPPWRDRHNAEIRGQGGERQDDGGSLQDKARHYIERQDIVGYADGCETDGCCEHWQPPDGSVQRIRE
jgi:hypothetical protein